MSEASAIRRPPVGRGRALRLLLAFSLQSGGWLSVVFLAAAVGHEATTLASVYGGKLLIDAAVDGTGPAVLAAAALWAGAYGVAEGCTRAAVAASAALHERVALALDARLMALLGGLPGLEHHERPEYLDEVALLRSQRLALVRLPNVVGMVAGRWVALLGSATLLARLDPLLLLLPLAGLGSVWTGRRAHEIRQHAERANAEAGRLRRHLFTTAASAAAAGELRVFGLTDTLVARHREVAQGMAREQNRAVRRVATLNILATLLAAVGTTAATGLVLLRAVQGAGTAGDVVLVLGLGVQLSVAARGVVEAGDSLRESLTAAVRYLWLEDAAAPGIRVPSPSAATRTPRSAPRTLSPLSVPARLADGITVEGVSFRYPGTGADVLRDVSLHLPPGAVVALVGENGAGKSTLVKLLARFYEPDAGRILVDGTDLRRLDQAAWREHLSAAFQDFQRFEFRLRETVGVGHLPALTDPQAVSAALTRAGADDIVSKLPGGLETQLGRNWPGGVDLSGGQWQKLALGRGLMREAPLLLLFDEPTASLDAQTEHALFERLAAATRAGETRGAVTVLVSHRFSTVRMADRIVVLDGGRVHEVGSHEQLLAAGGLYAELYELQARAYRSAETDTPPAAPAAPVSTPE